MKKRRNRLFRASKRILEKLINTLKIEDGHQLTSSKHSGLNSLITTGIILEKKRTKMAIASTAMVYILMLSMVMYVLRTSIKMVNLRDP